MSDSPIGIINGVYLYQRDLDWSRKLIAEYEAKATGYEARAAIAGNRQKGAYLSHAKQARANANRMKANLASQQASVGNWDPRKTL